MAPENSSSTSTRNYDQSAAAISPGISTAFLVVECAVFGLIGGALNEHTKNRISYTILSNTEASIEICLDALLTTPRPLSVQRLQEETDLLRQTLQTVVDRMLVEGHDIQLDNFTQTVDQEQGSVCLIENYYYTTKENTQNGDCYCVYSRTNALAVLTLNRVTVNNKGESSNSSLAVQFGIVEASNNNKRLAEAVAVVDNNRTEISQKIRHLKQQPRILYFEGHAFYDRLQRDWWRLPMVQFWAFIGVLCCPLTVSFVAKDIFEPSTPLQVPGWRSWEFLCMSCIVIPLTILSFNYFRRTGVFERIFVRTLRLRAQLDNDMARVSILVAVCFVPFVQDIGLRLVADLKILSVTNPFLLLVFFIKLMVAVVCLLSYPFLSCVSALYVSDLF